MNTIQEQIDNLESIISNYSMNITYSYTFDNAYNLLKLVAPHILQLKCIVEDMVNEEKDNAQALIEDFTTNILSNILSYTELDYNLHTTAKQNQTENIQRAYQILEAMADFPMTKYFRNIEFSDYNIKWGEIYSASLKQVGKQVGDIHFVVGVPEKVYYPKINLKTEREEFYNCKNSFDYKSFIEKYPNSKFRQEAQQRLQDREYKEEDERWEILKKYHNYGDYIQEYPNGKYINEAKRLYDEYDDYLYFHSKAPWGYNTYLAQYPNGKHAKEAQAKIDLYWKKKDKQQKNGNKEVKIVGFTLLALFVIYMVACILTFFFAPRWIFILLISVLVATILSFIGYFVYLMIGNKQESEY